MRRPLISAVLSFTLGCAEPVEDPTVSLAVISDEITFRSVVGLGPHHLLATIIRVEEWEDGTTDEHDETLELSWNNWDRYHLRRLVDGKTVFESIVFDGQAYSRTRGAAWRSDLDVEPARLTLRTTWNMWKSAFDAFDDRIVLTEVGPSTVDTRPARRFTVGLSTLPEGTRVRRGQLQPEQVSGDVWLDEATAVRLSANVTGVARQRARRHTVQFQLTRSGIGTEQSVIPPAVRIRKPSDLLRQRSPPRNRSSRRRPQRQPTTQP